jgi:ABC-2 type transport system ATP-binding protein
MLEALNLRKTFARSVAVDDVSFSVREGEILGLIGPNGAGKTTTIRLILNILKPDSGTIRYHHHLFSESTRNSLGYLPEERGLYRKSRLLDTVLYFIRLRGVKGVQAGALATKWLKLFDLQQQAGRRLEELSKGNQQKVQFILAVAHDPWLIILDEPFSGLDPLNQMLMQETITSLRREGKCFILSTHQMETAERMSDTITLIHNGKVLLQGNISDLKQRHRAGRVRLEFEGDVNVLTHAPGLGQVTPFPGGAECELHGERTSELLAFLSQQVNLKRFELVEPSLHSIFLSTIRNAS